MPRKTRKQKEKTQKKRELQAPLQEVVKREFEFTFSGSNLKEYTSKRTESSFRLEQNRLLARDLAKTAIIAVGILSLELVIYWARFV